MREKQQKRLKFKIKGSMRNWNSKSRACKKKKKKSDFSKCSCSYMFFHKLCTYLDVAIFSGAPCKPLKNIELKQSGLAVTGRERNTRC